MSKVVKCHCEECHHNDNFACTADGIEVKSSGDLKVKSADGTACNTFKIKSQFIQANYLNDISRLSALLGGNVDEDEFQ